MLGTPAIQRRRSESPRIDHYPPRAGDGRTWSDYEREIRGNFLRLMVVRRILAASDIDVMNATWGPGTAHARRLELVNQVMLASNADLIERYGERREGGGL